MNRAAFLAAVQATLFEGFLTDEQVEGMTAILDGWERYYPVGDTRWLAYSLATAYHETGYRMVPVEEIGRGRGHAYGQPDPVTGKVFFGRGLVQISWKNNYAKADLLLTELRFDHVDLVGHPEDALRSDVAVALLLVGLARGIYTGRKLGDYFSATHDDWYRARRCVNGLDCADAIARYHRNFLAALT